LDVLKEVDRSEDDENLLIAARLAMVTWLDESEPKKQLDDIRFLKSLRSKSHGENSKVRQLSATYEQTYNVWLKARNNVSENLDGHVEEQNLLKVGLLEVSGRHRDDEDVDMDSARKLEKDANSISAGEIVVRLMGMTSIIESILNLMLVVLFLLSLCEILEDEAKYAHWMSCVRQIASFFIRTCLPLFERTCIFDTTLLQSRIFEKSTKGLGTSKTDIHVRLLIQRVRVLDAFFSALDIYIFPPSFQAGSQRGAKSLEFSHIDPNVVLVAGYDGIIRMFQVSSKTCLGCFVGHKSIATGAAFSALDHWIASCSFDRTLRIWNAMSAECTHVLCGHEDGVTSIIIAPKDAFIASASLDRSVRLWAGNNWDCIRVFKGHTNWVKCLSFCQSRGSVVSAGLDCKVLEWSADSSLENYGSNAGRGFASLEEHSDFVVDVQCFGNQYAVSTGRDKRTIIWDLQEGTKLCIIKEDRAWNCCLDISEDGKWLACGSFDNQLTVYRLPKGRMVRKCLIHNDGILSVKITRNGLAVLIGTQGGRVQVINL
jgi:hypothetical protein